VRLADVLDPPARREPVGPHLDQRRVLTAEAHRSGQLAAHPRGAVLPTVIALYRDLGFRFVTVPELLGRTTVAAATPNARISVATRAE